MKLKNNFGISHREYMSGRLICYLYGCVLSLVQRHSRRSARYLPELPGSTKSSDERERQRSASRSSYLPITPDPPQTHLCRFVELLHEARAPFRQPKMDRHWCVRTSKIPYRTHNDDAQPDKNNEYHKFSVKTVLRTSKSP